MADRAQPVRSGFGQGAAITVAALIIACLGAVMWRADAPARLGPADWAAIRFTVSQALVSAALSVVCAIPVARALARRRFPGRAILITLLGAPFLLPVIVAVMGLLEIFGRAGWINLALAALGLPRISIYGAHGVILAHVFFNLPLATRLILQGWSEIPAERFRLAALAERGPVRDLVPVGMAHAAADCAGCFCGDLWHLPDQLFRGFDLGRRPKGHNGRAGHLSGVPV